jgi:TatD DNase family protein
MTFIDTHAHLYLNQFEEDCDEMLARCHAQGVHKIYLPAIDSRSHAQMLALEKRHPESCIAMMGLHPCSVKENYEAELKTIFDYWAQRDFVAVGEIGLDLYWDKTFFEQQQDAFRRQMQFAKAKKRPIVIHARESMNEIMPMVAAEKTDDLQGIFHCYSGTLAQAHECVELGFYLGIGGALTYKKSGLDDIIKHIALEHLVLETDAPFLTPTPHRGKRNESSYIPLIAQKLAEVKGVSIQEIAEVTTANAQRVFSQ